MKSDRAKSALAFAKKTGRQIDINTIDGDRAAIIRSLNRPAGERVIQVRIIEVVERQPIATGGRISLANALKRPLVARRTRR